MSKMAAVGTLHQQFPHKKGKLPLASLHRPLGASEWPTEGSQCACLTSSSLPCEGISGARCLLHFMGGLEFLSGPQREAGDVASCPAVFLTRETDGVRWLLPSSRRRKIWRRPSRNLPRAQGRFAPALSTLRDHGTYVIKDHAEQGCGMEGNWMRPSHKGGRIQPDTLLHCMDLHCYDGVPCKHMWPLCVALVFLFLKKKRCIM